MGTVYITDGSTLKGILDSSYDFVIGSHYPLEALVAIRWITKPGGHQRGQLHAPTKKLRSLTLPDLEPISYGTLWLWHHEHHDQDRTHIHTIVCGAARPSDLDQPMKKSSSFPRKKLLHI